MIVSRTLDCSRWVALMLLVATCLPANAQTLDDIYLRDKDGKAGRRVQGTVVDFTGEQLTVRTSVGRDETIPTERIERVETYKGDDHLAGDKAFQQRQYANALTYYGKAIRAEQRRWMRRQILARSIQCYANTGQVERAGEGFRYLYQDDPATQFFSCIPLCWRTQQPTPTLLQQARTWIATEKDPISVLMGASWLLATQERAQAVAALQKLSLQPDARIAMLATAQLWRTRLIVAEAAEIDQWRGQLERIPADLQVGPHFVLGLALARMKQHQPAALSFLRAPILAHEQLDLAAAGTLEAARQLELLGRTTQARRLYEELVTQYDGTAAAAEAKARTAQ